MKQIEIQKGTVIKIHGEDPAGKLAPYDIFYQVKDIEPTPSSPFRFGFKGPAMFVNLLKAVPEKGGWPSHSGEFIPKKQFASATHTARIDAEGSIGDYKTSTEVIDKAAVPAGLVFMDG